MPKIQRKVTVPVDRESEVLAKLTEVLWHHGDFVTQHCQDALRKAKIAREEITAPMLHKAEEANRERLRESFVAANNDPGQRLKVIVSGDERLDPARNADHPFRGLAAIQRDVENRSKIDSGMSETEDDDSPKEREKSLPEQSSQRETVQDDAAPLRKQPRGPSGKRYALFGHPVSGVIRWMGKAGYNREEAKRVLAHYGIEVSVPTLVIYLKAGAGVVDRPGRMADVTTEQAAEIERASGRKPAKKRPSKK